MSTLLLRQVEVEGSVADALVSDGLIAAVGGHMAPPAGAQVVHGDGGALIPGLWDHHLHLLALAAARRSVDVGPHAVGDQDGLVAALERARPASPGGWIRAVGYHESVAGDLDRDDLDRLLPGVPVRVQHRSGALWILSSAAIDRLGLEGADGAVLERDHGGRPTGRVYGGDRWLGARVRAVDPEKRPDLAHVGRELASHGTVGVTDATPMSSVEELRTLAAAVGSGAIPQHVTAMGGPPIAGAAFPSPLHRGPVKVYLADHDLPPFDEVVGWIRQGHDCGRPVAIHCVTRVALVLALAALDEAGHDSGDRIEHGAVVPPEIQASLRAAGLTVVTQPGFVAERGDAYWREVDPVDRPHLYPCASLDAAGVRVAGSTDAPFGQLDPWRAIAAAVDRTTVHGRVVGAAERVSARRALDLFLGAPHDPGGPVRRVTPGAPADLCLLHARLDDVLREPSAAAVRMTIVGGAVVHGS